MSAARLLDVFTGSFQWCAQGSEREQVQVEQGTFLHDLGRGFELNESYLKRVHKNGFVVYLAVVIRIFVCGVGLRGHLTVVLCHW